MKPMGTIPYFLAAPRSRRRARSRASSSSNATWLKRASAFRTCGSSLIGSRRRPFESTYAKALLGSFARFFELSWLMGVGPSGARVRGVVPLANHRPGPVMLVAEDAQPGRAEHEVPARARRQVEPASGEHAQDMSAREEQRVALDRPHPADHTIRARAHLLRRLSARAAVAEELPVRALGPDLGAAPPLVRAVVPLDQVLVDLGRGAEPRQLAGAGGALQRAREHPGEGQAAQAVAEPARVTLSALGQREIGQPRVLAGDAPGGLAVPGEMGGGKRIGHASV